METYHRNMILRTNVYTDLSSIAVKVSGLLQSSTPLDITTVFLPVE